MEFAVDAKNKYTNSFIFKNETGCELYIRDGVYFVNGCKSQDEANKLIASHNPTKPAEPTIQDKLASVGLSIGELKTALGL